MKRALKNYWAFTGRWYRVLILFMLPVTSVACVVAAAIMDAELMGLVYTILCMLLLSIEPMSDYWLIGGFYNKKRGGYRFLQSSNRFEKVMRDVVICDLLRRVLLHGGLLAITCFMAGLMGIWSEGWVVISVLPFLEIAIGEIEVFIGRHFDTWTHHFVVVLIGAMLSMPIMTNCILLGPDVVLVVDLVLVIVAIITAFGTVAYTKKKVRDSYYDK